MAEDVPEMPTADDVTLITVGRICAMTTMSERMIRGYIARGELPSVRLGRRVTVRLCDLREWIAGRQGGVS